MNTFEKMSYWEWGGARGRLTTSVLNKLPTRQEAADFIRQQKELVEKGFTENELEEVSASTRFKIKMMMSTVNRIKEAQGDIDKYPSKHPISIAFDVADEIIDVLEGDQDLTSAFRKGRYCGDMFYVIDDEDVVRSLVSNRVRKVCPIEMGKGTREKTLEYNKVRDMADLFADAMGLSHIVSDAMTREYIVKTLLRAPVSEPVPMLQLLRLQFRKNIRKFWSGMPNRAE